MVVFLMQRLLEELKQSTLTNSEDQDEMQHHEAFHLGSTLFVKVKTISKYRNTS